MTKKERAVLRIAVKDLMSDEDGGFQRGVIIVAKMAGLVLPGQDLPDLDIVTMQEIASRANCAFGAPEPTTEKQG